MPLSKEQQALLEASRSAYGCGLDTCKRCYPIQYACAFCGEQFPTPIANGETYECEECNYNNNSDKEN